MALYTPEQASLRLLKDDTKESVFPAAALTRLAGELTEVEKAIKACDPEGALMAYLGLNTVLMQFHAKLCRSIDNGRVSMDASTTDAAYASITRISNSAARDLSTGLRTCLIAGRARGAVQQTVEAAREAQAALVQKTEAPTPPAAPASPTPPAAKPEPKQRAKTPIKKAALPSAPAPTAAAPAPAAAAPAPTAETKPTPEEAALIQKLQTQFGGKA